MEPFHDPLLKKLRVTSVTPETAYAVNLVLEPIDWSPVCRAGQFITLVFTTPFGEKRRSYSISSCTELGEALQITVKKIENGEFSRPLNDMVKAGDLLLTTGISGVFTLPPKPSDDFAFLAAGSGITPCYPMIRVLLARTNCNVTLIYSSKSREQALFLSQLEELQKNNSDRFRLYTLFSDSKELHRRRLGNWLLEQLLDRYVTAPERTSFYLCGPFEFMQMCRIVVRVRVPASRIHTESFDQRPRLPVSAPPDTAEHEVLVQLGTASHKIRVKYPLTVTKAARLQGLRLPYSCEAGRCASCVASLVQGKVWMAYNEVLTDEEIRGGRVLTCQAVPQTDDVIIRFS